MTGHPACERCGAAGDAAGQVDICAVSDCPLRKPRRVTTVPQYVPPLNDWQPLAMGCYHRRRHGGAE